MYIAFRRGFGVAAFLFAISAAHLHAAEPITIITLGDSITKGVREGVKADETFSAILEKSLKEKGIDATVVNVGIGGERTDQALLRLERDVIAKKPLIVTVMYGTNDSYVDPGAKESRLTVDAFEKNLRELVSRLRAAEITPILMTEPRWGDKASANGVGEHPNERLEKFMAATRAVTKDVKVPLIDNYQIWSDRQAKGDDIGEWTTDQCHPNAQGHHIIAETMLPTIVESIKARAAK